MIDYQDFLHYLSDAESSQMMEASMRELRHWRSLNALARIINVETLFEEDRPARMRGLRVWFERL